VNLRALVVIPAYNEAARLPGLLDELSAHLARDTPDDGPDLQFWIVDDGSRPEEFAVEERLTREAGLGEAVKLIRLDANRGKGGAIRAGFEAGLETEPPEGFDYLGFMDADCSVSVRELHRALMYLVAAHRDHGVVGVVGSRVRMLGRQVARDPIRHMLGRVFATFVSRWFRQAVYDTQCGLKIFAQETLRRYIRVPDDTRWVWDTQLLLAMLDAGETIHEFPVDWRETGHSKVSLVRDPLTMVWHLVRFRRRLRAGGGPSRPAGAA